MADERGTAIIPALLVVVIVAAAASAMALGQRLSLRRAQHLKDRAHALGLGAGGLDAAALLLAANASRTHTPGTLARWERGLADFSSDAPGALSVRIEDAQGRFNLNSLWRSGGPSPADIAVFHRLLKSLDLDPSLTEALLDWLDPDLDRRPNGAEDSDYLACDPPYRAANRPMESSDELRWVRGFDAKSLERLRPWITALPQATEININTAPSRVLAALFSDAKASVGDRLAAGRENEPFGHKSQLTMRAGMGPMSEGPFGLSSSYFLVETQTRLGSLQRRTDALVFRPLDGAPARILWRASVR